MRYSGGEGDWRWARSQGTVKMGYFRSFIPMGVEIRPLSGKDGKKLVSRELSHE